MLARQVDRASGSRAEGVGLSQEAENCRKNRRARSAWKRTYDEHVWEKSTLDANQRAALHALLRASDHLGRVWQGQPTLAARAGYSVRTLRRVLAQLVQLGYLRMERRTFKMLAIEQAELGLPLPDRTDNGEAPLLLTLLFKGELASCQMLRQDKPRAAGIPREQFDHRNEQGRGSQTRSVDAPKPPGTLAADHRDFSALLICNVEGDPEQQPHPTLVLDDEPEAEIVRPPTIEQCVRGAKECMERAAWRVLCAAYDKHFIRVYHTQATNKRVSAEDENVLTACMVDMAKLLEARLHERNVDVMALEKTPLELLADEALRSWFDGIGTNGYLRRVSHPMKCLRHDLVYRTRQALMVLVEQHAPKPERRRIVAPAVLLNRVLGQDKRQGVKHDPAISLPIFVPAALRLPQPPICADAQRILDGLSLRTALAELGTHVSLATELLAQARDCGADVDRVLNSLDRANERVASMLGASKAAKTNAVMAAVLHALQRGEA